MGAFYIRRAGTYQAPGEVLRQQGFSAGERLTAGPYAVEVYPRQQDTRPPIQRFEGDDFIAAAGTVLLHSARDTDALEALYAGFTPGEPLGGEAMGMHGLVIRKRGRTFVTADALGAFPIFYSRKTSSVSTSFLALAAEAPRLTVTRQGAAEYVLNGAIVGDDTLVGEIQRLPFGAILELTADGAHLHQRAVGVPDPDPRPRAELLIDATVRVDRYMQSVLSAFDGSLSCAITGGYDSRLLLALALKNGAAPRAIVYGEGGTDVQVA